LFHAVTLTWPERASSRRRLQSLVSAYALALDINLPLLTCAEVCCLVKRRQSTAAFLHSQLVHLDEKRPPAAAAGAHSRFDFLQAMSPPPAHEFISSLRALI
jgi:hypothetical protein